MAEVKRRGLSWILNAPNVPNLADELTEEELANLGQEVIRGYDIDRNNRATWDSQSERALKLAQQVLETKSVPWPKASNVKHPLITVATIQFAARAYPEICRMGKVVKAMITGEDKVEEVEPAGQRAPSLPSPYGASTTEGFAGSPTVPPQLPIPPQAAMPLQAGFPIDPRQVVAEQTPLTPISRSPKVGPKQARAQRIEAHMNWQLTVEQETWEEDMDCLLHVLPVLGQCFKKSYFCSKDGHNISELVLPNDCYVSKQKGRDIRKAQRITHRLWIYQNEVIEKIRNGVWLDIGNLGPAITDDSDVDAPHEFLEQHRLCDLDGDGYKEPYIVTVHKQTGKVVRVAARWDIDGVEATDDDKSFTIEADHYFTHYPFIPNPDGSINALGFGQLLEPINAAANTALNQLLDAGHLANAGGGFIGRGARLRGGTWTFRPGEWKLVDVQGGMLKENIVPNPVREPSTVLFQLLGFLVQSGKEISSVHDLLTGGAEIGANMPVGTVMALVEQGLKVFVGIYKRIYRSLTKEFQLLYKLNARFLDPKVSFYIAGDKEESVERSDYKKGDTLVLPVADPELSSDMQRLLKGQALRELTGRPGINEIELTRRLVRGVRPENPESLLLTDGQLSGEEKSPWEAPPHPQQILARAKAIRMEQQAKEAQARLQMDMAKLQLEVVEIQSRIENIKADSILKVAKAEELSDKTALAIYKEEMDVIAAEVSNRTALLKEIINKASQPAPEPTGEEGMGMPEMPETPELGEGLGEEDMGMMGVESRQAGGPVEEGRPFLVGERGPEAFIPTHMFREPSSSESAWFKSNPLTTGMADFDNDRIVLNPFSKHLTEKERQAVAVNEAARLAMKRHGIEPDFIMTDLQNKVFKDYGDDLAKKETIVGRILSGDPTAMDVTPYQREFANRIKALLVPEAGGDMGPWPNTEYGPKMLPREYRDIEDVISQARSKYPILNKYEIGGSYSDKPLKYKGDIEAWPPGEEGESDYRRPVDIPVDAFGVEVYRKGKTRPIDVLGDAVSHYLVDVDPTLKGYYQRFKQTITPEQKKGLKEDYKYAKKNLGETRPFNVYLERSRLPAYFRGYTFKQWTEEQSRQRFTKEQIKLFNEVREYLGVK